MGSAPNAAATATTSHPVKQGLIQAFGVLTDTLVICTSTALIILFSDAYHQPGLSGIALSQAALSDHVGAWASGFLAVLMLLFGFSALMGNYYYGETNIGFLSQNKNGCSFTASACSEWYCSAVFPKSSLCGIWLTCSWA